MTNTAIEFYCLFIFVDIISRLVEVTDSKTVERLLVGGGTSEVEGVLARVLILIREKLTKEQWKEYPVHKQALVWCVKQLKVV